MFDLITIGDATFDTFLVLDEHNSSCQIKKDKRLLCLNYADKTPIMQTAQSVGGNAANVAAGLRKLGFATSIITEIGDDVTGHVILQELEEAKVDTSLIKIHPGKATRYSIVLNFQAERTVLSYYVKRNYKLPHIPHTNWLYYTSLGEGFEAVQKKLITYIGKHPSVRLAMNPGSYQMKQGRSELKKIIPFLDILFLNREEAFALLHLKKKTISHAMNAFHRRGVRTVVITDNTDGSYASDGEAIWHMPVYPIAPLAKTGAGDAYASGFLAATIHGKHVPEAMRWGTANAGAVITQFGAQKGLGTRATINRIMKKYPSVKPTKV